MHKGKLLALGTPDEVKRLMRGTILEVRASIPRRATGVLRKKLGADSVSLFGDKVHVATSAPEGAARVLDYSAKIAAEFSQTVLVKRFSRLKGSAVETATVKLQTRAWFNENLESRNFYVPGVIAIIVMLITLMLTSMAVVREKEIGAMEQIMVTPITPTEFILGKTIPFALLGFADVVLITVLGVFWFEAPIRGSLLMLFASRRFRKTLA